MDNWNEFTPFDYSSGEQPAAPTQVADDPWGEFKAEDSGVYEPSTVPQGQEDWKQNLFKEITALNARQKAKEPDKGYGVFGESFGILTPEQQQEELTRRFSEYDVKSKQLKEVEAKLADPDIGKYADFYRRGLEFRRDRLKNELPDIKQLTAIRQGMAKPFEKTALRAAAETVPQAFATGVLSIPEFVGIVKGYLTEEKVDDDAILQWAQESKKYVRKKLPGDEARQGDFNQKLAAGLGSMASFYGGGALASLAKAGPKTMAGVIAAMGAMASGSEGFEEATKKLEEARIEAEKKGEEPAVQEIDRILQTFGYAAVGTTEALPIVRTIQRFKQPVTRLGQRAIASFESATEEGLQEGPIQQFIQNLISIFTTDPNRQPGQSVVESAAIGALLGGTTGAVLSGRGAQQQAVTATPAAEQPQPTPAQPTPETAPVEPVAAHEKVSRETAPMPEGRKGMDVIQFIRNKGGIKPTGELAAIDAKRYPGLVSEKGLDADKIREALVEAGYLEEAGPDQPAITTPQDVYNLIERSIGGERVVPLAEKQADEQYQIAQEAKDYQRELDAAEKNFVIPEIAAIDEANGDNALAQAYASFNPDEKAEIIDRNRRGENVDDLIEEMSLRSAADEVVSAVADELAPIEEAQAPKLRSILSTMNREGEEALRTRLEGMTDEEMKAAAETSFITYGRDLSGGELVDSIVEGAKARREERLAAASGGGFIEGTAPARPSIKAMAVPRETKTIPEEARGVFYDILESNERIGGKENAIAKRLGIEPRQVADLALEAERAGWLKRTDDGKLRRVAKGKRPARPEAPVVAPDVQAIAIAPSVSPTEGMVAKTPAAQERYAEIVAGVRHFATKMLPEGVTVKGEDFIKIATDRARDQLLAMTGETKPVSRGRRKRKAPVKEFPYHEPNTDEFKLEGFRGEWKELKSAKDDEGNLQRRREYKLYKEGEKKPVATMKVRTATNGRAYVYDVEAPGIGAKFYDAVEAHFGSQLRPLNLLTEAGYTFWRKRDPEAVKWHQWSKNEEYYVSPRELLRWRKEGNNSREASILWNALPLEAHVVAQDPELMFAMRKGGELQALGQTNPIDMVISLGMRAIELEAVKKGKLPLDEAIRVFRHEVVEFYKAFGDVIFKKGEWELLEKAARENGWVETTNVRDAYTQLYQGQMSDADIESLILKEAIAEQFSEYVGGRKEFPSKIAKIFERVKQFLMRVGSWMKGNGFTRWEDVFNRIEAGEFRRRFEEAFPDIAFKAKKPGEISPVVRAGEIPGARGFQPAAGMGEVRPLRDIISDLRRTIGMPVVRQGIDPALKREIARATKQAVQNGVLPPTAKAEVGGQYAEQTGIIRLAIMDDIDSFAHEGGHHLERTLGNELQAILNQHAQEVEALAYPGAKNKLSEGFAEFFRLYVLNPNYARAKAPNFISSFDGMLNRSHPDIMTNIMRVQNDYDAFLAGDPNVIGEANITIPERGKSELGQMIDDSRSDGLTDTISDRLHILYYNIISRAHGWYVATRDLLNITEMNTGKRIDLKSNEHPGKILRMASHTQAWALSALKRGIAMPSRPQGGGVSMHDVLATVFGSTNRTDWNQELFGKFNYYLIARQAVRDYVRYRPEFRKNVTDFVSQHPEVDYLLANLPTKEDGPLDNAPTLEPLGHHLAALVHYEANNPNFKLAASQYYNFNNDIRQYLLEKGLISQDDFAMLSRNTDYAPFQRDMSDRVLISGQKAARRGGGRGQTANKYAVYKAKRGSRRPIIAPVQSTIQFVYEMHLRAALNDTMRALDSLAQKAGAGSGAIFERLPAHEAAGYTVDIQNALKKAAKEAGLSESDTATMLGNVEGFIGENAATVLFTQKLRGEKGERIIWFYENGKPVPARLGDTNLGRIMFEAFTSVGERTSAQFFGLMALPANLLRSGVVEAPSFIVRNIFVDSFVSAINSPYATPFYTQFQGLKQIITSGKYLDLYNRYGGLMGGELYASVSDQTIERDFETLRNRGFQIARPRTMKEFLKTALQIGEFSETATRVGIFKKAYESARKDGATDMEALTEAAYASHDVMDFSRYGSRMELLGRIIPFLRASVTGMDKYMRSMTAQSDYGSAITTWIRYRMGDMPAGMRQELTGGEKKALAQAAKAWFYTTVVMGGMSLIAYALGPDDEDKEEIPDRIRATHWIVSINGILHFIPKDIKTFMNLPEKSDIKVRLPKGFETAWVANFIERGLDYTYKNDPTAFDRYMRDLWEITAPPNSIPALDIPYGFMTGKDLYSQRDIIPFWQKEMARKEQYGPYTPEIAKLIGKRINVPPYYIDYLIRGFGANVGRDAEVIGDMISKKGPTPSVADYPVFSRFTYNTARNSRSIEEFNKKVRDKEGVVAWFWDTVTSGARSFTTAANQYRVLLKDNDDEASANDFYDTLTDDQKAYATLEAQFTDSKSKYRNIHPIENANDGIKVTNGLMREIVDGKLSIGKQTKTAKALGLGGTEVQLSRETMAATRNELGHIRKAMAQNALNILGVPGWVEKKRADINARMEVIKAASPHVYKELIRRLREEKYMSFDRIADVWPKAKQRLLEKRDKAILGDLYRTYHPAH